MKHYVLGADSAPLQADSTSSAVYCQFLGAFAKLRKVTISFVMSVRPSVSMEQLGCHWADSHEILLCPPWRRF